MLDIPAPERLEPSDAMPPLATRKRSARKSDTITGRLKAADPFDLIRWLARSQPDPRKALAELVQNAIDAGARHVRLSRLRERGVVALHLLDDGTGVIPELSRTEALTYVATHVGHSRKRNLTPEQRRELMMQGKYGIGLLGFWAIGRELEIRTQLPGEPAYLLRLHEDEPRYEIERFRSRLHFGDAYTEVVVRGLHRTASMSLTARRMADYLAAELRGQLLARDVEILVHDGIARGRAQKVIEVRPARYSGERLDVPAELPCPGFAPIRVELYRLPEGHTEEGRVAVTCAGTVVYDDVGEFEAADLRLAPWTDRRLTGLLEFSGFEVPPGSRRGVIPDAAALAFAEALAPLTALVCERLRAANERVTAAIEAGLLRQLERAFRDLPRLAPEYDFFAVRPDEPAIRPPAGGGADAGAATNADAASETERGSGDAAGSPGVAMPGSVPIPSDADLAGEESEADADRDRELFPPGPLASLAIVPAVTRLERHGERRLRAELRDAHGARIRRPVEVTWDIAPPLGRLERDSGMTNVFRAGSEPGSATVVATAREEAYVAAGEARIDIVEAIDSAEQPRAGIPEPVFVAEPMASWRSRMRDGAWEVNSEHPDFRVAAESGRRKLRYLTALLAKEVVLHSFPSPQLEAALERLVGVQTIAERGLERG